jgi:hypothetical protein
MIMIVCQCRSSVSEGKWHARVQEVADALLAVIEHLEARSDHALVDDKAIIAFKELMHSVATVKERHGRKAYRPRGR